MGLIVQIALGCGTEPTPQGAPWALLELVAKRPSVQQDEDFIQSSQGDN